MFVPFLANLITIPTVENLIRAYHNLLIIKAEPLDWGSSANKIINFEDKIIIEYSKDLLIFPGGNRVATDGVDNYGQLWTTIDKLRAYVLASQILRIIVFYEINSLPFGLKIRVSPPAGFWEAPLLLGPINSIIYGVLLFQ